MKNCLLIYLFLASIFTFSCASKREVVNVQLIEIAEEEKLLEQVFFGFEIEQANGKKKRTYNLPEGAYQFKKLQVFSPYGTFRNGRLYLHQNVLVDQLSQVPVFVGAANSSSYIDTFWVDVLVPTKVRATINGRNTINAYTKNQLEFEIQTTDSTWRNLAETHWNWKEEGENLLFQCFLNDVELQPPYTFWLNQSEQEVIDSVKVKIQATFDSSMFQESIFPVEFEEKTVLNFSGLDGANGQDGQDGSYSDYATAGENGLNGSAGEAVKIYADIFSTEHRKYLSVWVIGKEHEYHRWIPVDRSVLVVKTNGGRGGRGGSGGDGIAGTEEQPAAEPGQPGGNGGNGGDGGVATIFVTPKAEKFLNRIEIENFGGAGGQRGIGGRGGLHWQEQPRSLLGALLNVNNAGRGSKGLRGLDGKKGPEHEIIVISSQEMQNGFLPK